MNDAPVGFVDILDGVFNRYDVAVALMVYDVYHRGERRGFPAARGTGHDEESVTLVAERLDPLRHAKLRERAKTRVEPSQGDGARIAGTVHVEAVPHARRTRHRAINGLLPKKDLPDTFHAFVDPQRNSRPPQLHGHGLNVRRVKCA